MGDLGELVERTAVLGLERASLRGREALVGQAPPGEVRERGADPRQSLAEARRERALRGLARRWPHEAQRVAQERRALDVALSRAPGTHERERLAPDEAVSLDRADEALLRAARDPAQRHCERQPDQTLVDARRDGRPERVGEKQSRGDPGRLAAEEPFDRVGPEPVLLVQRAHHARLVHGRDRAPRRVRPEHERASLGHAARAVDDDRHARPPLRAPALDALEAVDDDVASARAHDDARRELGQRAPARDGLHAATLTAQRREADVEGLEGHEDDGGHGLSARSR